MLGFKLNCLLLAISCTAVLATNPFRQISVDVQETEWGNLGDPFRASRVKNSARNEVELQIQLDLMETDERIPSSEDSPNAKADQEFSDELTVELDETDPGSEETGPIDEDTFDESTAKDSFAEFVIAYKRQYASAEEHAHRYNVFKQNLLHIQELNNNPNGTATYGITKFADLTTAEFRQRHGFFTFAIDDLAPHNASIKPRGLQAPPKSFDWRSKHIITPVKSQGECGACWAFATVGAIEAMHAKRTKRLEDLSEQQLVDCDVKNKGCDGGDPVWAYKAVQGMGGLVSECDYPYTAERCKCNFHRDRVRVRVRSGQRLPQNEQIIAQNLYQHGPVAMGINSADMHHYCGGVSHPPASQCPRDTIDHYVLAVGYGEEDIADGRRLPYWIIKNSWGLDFGEEGYYKIYRGDNSCAVRLYNSIVTLE